jgi:hypothetical protein
VTDLIQLRRGIEHWADRLNQPGLTREQRVHCAEKLNELSMLYDVLERRHGEG